MWSRFRLVSSCLNRNNRFALSLIRCFDVPLRTSDRDRSSRHPRVISIVKILLKKFSRDLLAHVTSSKIKMEFGSAQWNDVAVIGELISSIGANKFARYRNFGCCNDFEYIYTFSNRTLCTLFNRLINTFVLSQNSLQMTAQYRCDSTDAGSMLPCLSISLSVCTLPSRFVTLITRDWRTNRIFSLSKILKNDIANRLIYRTV